MNEQYISLFQQYQAVNPLVSEAEFQGYIDKYGDEYLTMVDEEIKKKIPSDQSLSGNQSSTDTIPTEITEQMNGLPMNQVDSRYEQGVTLPSDTQPQTSSESVSTPQQPSTELGSPIGQSTSEENLINTENISTNPASEDVGNLSIPSVPIINPNVQNLGERINQNNARLDYIDNFYDQNAVMRKGNITMTFDEIDPVEALGGTPKTSNVTEDNLTYISAREGLDAQGNPISVEQETKLYEDWKAKGYGEVYEREGKPVFATNEKGRKALAPLYQTKTEPIVPTIEEPPTPLKSFLDELSLYGAVPTDEERERMVDTDYREEYLLSTQAAYWAKENGTTFQEEYDRLNTDAKYDDTQKIQIASTILNVLNEGIEREGNSADTKEEQDYYNTIRQNPQVLADFGDYLAKNGMDDISFVRGRSFTSQKNRKRLIDEYTNFRLEKEQITMEAAEQSAKASEARLPLFERSGDSQGYNAEVARTNGFKNTYNQAATRAKQIQDNYANVQPIFKKINRQNNELADFTVRIENNEVGANAVNILGQFPLVVGQKVTSLIGGIGRLANAAIGSENFRDALDIMATEEIKIGNVTAGKIANRVEYFKDSNGAEYKEINGTLYSLKDGKIRRIKGNVDKSQLTSQSKDTEYNFTGVVNMTTGLVADALLTRGAMSGLSRGAKFTDYAAKSKRVGEFFGANSQIAKGMSSLSTVMKNPSAANFAYWNTQFMQDSYIAAKEGGITSETGRYIYAISQSVGLATISQINPDINILKAMGNSNRSLVNALLRNDIPAAQKAFGTIMDYGKKAGINIAKEVPEELLQQGYQDFSAMLVNQIADKNIKVSEVQDYKELAVGTIGSVALAAAFGGRANVNIGGDNVDVNNMTQPEILTLLARTPNGLEQLKSAKEDVYFESQRTLTDTLIKDVETRKKYLDKIPDIEKYSVAKLSEVVPVMQELERKREQLKNDDGTFAETLNNEINSLTSQVNSILTGQPEVQNTQETPLPNEETTQPTQESETVQEQTTVAENEPEQVQTTGTEESSVNKTDFSLDENIFKPIENPSISKMYGRKDRYDANEIQLKNGETAYIVWNKESDSVQIKKITDGKLENIATAVFNTSNKDTNGGFITSYDESQSIFVDPKYRRMGLATNMIDFAQSKYNLPFQPSNVQSESFKNFWSTYNEEQQPETTTEPNEGTVATEQNILPDIEDDVEFDENGLNRLVGILNEASQGNNIGADGNTELGTNSIQQTEQGEQESTEAVSETTDSTGGQENAEVDDLEFLKTQHEKALKDVDNTLSSDPSIKEKVKILSEIESKIKTILFNSANIIPSENLVYLSSNDLVDYYRQRSNSELESIINDFKSKGLVDKYEAQQARDILDFNESNFNRKKRSFELFPNEGKWKPTTTTYKVRTPANFANWFLDKTKEKEYSKLRAENEKYFPTKKEAEVALNKLLDFEAENQEAFDKAKDYIDSLNEYPDRQPNKQTKQKNTPNQQPPAFSENEQVQTLNTETVDQGKVLSAQEKKINNFIGLKNDYNRLSKAKKNQKEGKALLSRINQASRELGIPVGNAGDGKLSIKNPKTGKEMAKIRETVTEKTPSKQEIDFAKSHIPDLILWNGDASSQRWDTDLSWADIRKGASDIEKGNVNSVPAKRLINEVNRQANDLGGFNFIAGGGRIVDREFASLQEIEDSKKAFPKGWEALDNLTDEELKQIYDERKKSEEEFYTNRALQDENTNVYEQGQDVQSEGASNGEESQSEEAITEKLISDKNGTSWYEVNKPSFIKDNAKKWFKIKGIDGNEIYRSSNRIDYDLEGNKLPFGSADKLMEENKKIFDESNEAETPIKTLKEILLEKGISSFQFDDAISKSTDINELQSLFLDKEIGKQLEARPHIQREINGRIQYLQRNNNNQKTNTTSPEYQQLLKDRTAQEARVKSAKEKLDRVNKTTNNEFQADQENLFGERKTDGGMFDERADSNAARNVISEAKSEYDKSRAELTRINNAIRDFENGNASGTGEINFQRTDTSTQSLPQPVLEGLIEKLKKPFKKAFKNLNVVYDLDAALARARELGVSIEDAEFTTSSGEVYGFQLPDGTIYLNPDRFNANTAIHEFTHLWEQIMPNAWKKGVELFKNTQTGKNIFNQLKEEGNYSNLNEEQLWSEALNTHLGNYGGENWQNIRAQSNMDKLRDWFRDFIAKIGEVTGLNSYFGAPLTPETKLDRFTKGVMQDLFNGKALNPESGFEATDVPVVIKQMSDSELETMLTDLGIIQQGKCA